MNDWIAVEVFYPGCSDVVAAGVSDQVMHQSIGRELTSGCVPLGLQLMSAKMSALIV